jgi:LysR family transcriptional regulator, low CO2-responsive transcriptional regulator
LKNATLHQLKVFEAVARHSSFTRAAEELFLTQPTVSMQVKQLSKSVGLPLFEQVGKRLYLAVVTTAKYVVPRLLGPFCQRYPGIDVSLTVNNHEWVLGSLADNRDDLYILSQLPEDMDVKVYPFLENPLVVLAQRNHPLAHERNIPLKRLAEEPFIMREPGSGTRKAVQKLFDEHALQLKVKLDLGSNEAIKQAIAGGLGISVLSLHTLALEGHNSQLTILDVEGFPIERQWYVIYPSGKQLSVIARTFYDYLLNEGKNVAEETAFQGVFSKGLKPEGHDLEGEG